MFGDDPATYLIGNNDGVDVDVTDGLDECGHVRIDQCQRTFSLD
jgi:hypothetical protein